MKRYFLYLIALFAFICNTAFAQNPPAPAATNDTDIILAYSDGAFTFNKHFPFDKAFTIQITNIPAAINRIEIRIQDNSEAIGNYKKSLKTGNNPSDIVLPAWERHDLDPANPATTGTIVVSGYLKYNSDFLVKITASTVTLLSTEIKDALLTEMAADPGIENVINRMGTASAKDAADVLINYKADIIASLRKALQKKNPNYNFNEPDAIPVVVELKNFRQGILTINRQLDVFEKNSKNTDTQVKSLRKAVNALNWGSIIKDSDQYKNFKKTLDDLKLNEPTTSPALNTVKATLTIIDDAIDPIIDSRDELMNGLIQNVALINAYEASALNTSYDPNFANSAASYITLDIGIPYVSRIDRVMMYSGINIYFRPIDKSIPLERYKKWDRIRSRTSLLIGMSLASVEKAGERKGIIGSNALVLGLGYRILPFLKLTAGTFCHYRYDNNPVVDLDRYHFSTSPFIGLSIDADIKQLFSAFGTPFQ